MASKTPKSFSAVKSVCKVLGVHFYEKNSSLYSLNLFINSVLVVLQLALMLPSLAYFVRYSSDVNDAAEVLSILFPSVLYLWQYFILILTKPHLTVLFNGFEELIDQRA